MSTEVRPQKKELLRQEYYNPAVVSIRQVHTDLRIMRERPDQEPPPFQPGQYTLLGLGVWEPRVDRIPLHPVRDGKERDENDHYFPLTTREPENLDPSRSDYAGKAYLQDLVYREDFQKWIRGRFDPLKTHAYVCGNPERIGLPRRDREGKDQFPRPRGMRETLVDLGLHLDEPSRPETMHFEKYC